MKDTFTSIEQLKKQLVLDQQERHAMDAAVTAFIQEHPLPETEERYRSVHTGSTFIKPSALQRMMKHFVFVTAFCLVFFVSLSGAVVFASNDALPGDTLYPVKIGLEEVRHALTFSSEARANWAIQRIDKRFEEIEELALRDVNIDKKIIKQAEDYIISYSKDIESVSNRLQDNYDTIGLARISEKLNIVSIEKTQDLLVDEESSEQLVQEVLDEPVDVLFNAVTKISEQTQSKQIQIYAEEARSFISETTNPVRVEEVKEDPKTIKTSVRVMTKREELIQGANFTLVWDYVKNMESYDVSLFTEDNDFVGIIYAQSLNSPKEERMQTSAAWTVTTVKRTSPSYREVHIKPGTYIIRFNGTDIDGNTYVAETRPYTVIERPVSSFADCVAFGNPVYAGAPKTCMHNGKTYYEYIVDNDENNSDLQDSDLPVINDIGTTSSTVVNPVSRSITEPNITLSFTNNLPGTIDIGGTPKEDMTFATIVLSSDKDIQVEEFEFVCTGDDRVFDSVTLLYNRWKDNIDIIDTTDGYTLSYDGSLVIQKDRTISLNIAASFENLKEFGIPEAEYPLSVSCALTYIEIEDQETGDMVPMEKINGFGSGKQTFGTKVTL